MENSKILVDTIICYHFHPQLTIFEKTSKIPFFKSGNSPNKRHDLKKHTEKTRFPDFGKKTIGVAFLRKFLKCYFRGANRFFSEKSRFFMKKVIRT